MKRIVIVGTGARGTKSFATCLLRDFAGRVEIVGIHDINPKRMSACNELLDSSLPTFDDFDTMLREATPDAVLVTTKDCTHAEYVIKALDAGIDVFCEKPLCTTVDQVHRIRSAAAASQAEAFVTHNARFSPYRGVMKQYILNGVIGDVLHIGYTETLDLIHGADYFRRWHRHMANSAGLLVHKASHHFDLINWFAGSRPGVVTGQGRLAYYGENGPYHGERCSTCRHSEECPFYKDIFQDRAALILYKIPETEDGYLRDGCVFDPRIDIYDTMDATISYENGVVVSYSLTAYAAYESDHVAIQGTQGRLEFYSRSSRSAMLAEGLDGGPQLVNDRFGAGALTCAHLYLPHEKRIVEIDPGKIEGGHGGADPKLREMLFGEQEIEDPLRQKAPLEEGIQAVLVGLAANESIRGNGVPIDVQAL